MILYATVTLTRCTFSFWWIIK